MARTMILLDPATESSDAGTEPIADLQPLGSVKKIIELLAPFNTAPDRAESNSLGTMFLYGPGFVVEVPTALDEVTQIMVSVKEDEIAWPVLSRLCRALQWKMMDPNTGRTFG